MHREPKRTETFPAPPDHVHVQRKQAALFDFCRKQLVRENPAPYRIIGVHNRRRLRMK
jgi:hypothetical protein